MKLCQLLRVLHTKYLSVWLKKDCMELQIVQRGDYSPMMLKNLEKYSDFEVVAVSAVGCMDSIYITIKQNAE